MSLKSKLSPELRIALQLVHELQKQTETKPEGLGIKNSNNFLNPVITGLIGLVVGLGINYFQAQFQAEDNMATWKLQHNVEVSDKLLAIRIKLLNSFQKAITSYFEEDTETGIESNANALKTAIKIVDPKFNFKAFDKLPHFGTVLQIQESRKNWSDLEALSQSISVYYSEKTGQEADSLLAALNREPIHALNINYAIMEIQKMKKDNSFNYNNLIIAFGPYLMPYPHSLLVNKSLNIL